MRSVRPVILVTVILALAGCGGSPPSTPAATAATEGTATEMPEGPTAVPTPIETEQPTRAVTPLPTEEPTQAPTPSATPAAQTACELNVAGDATLEGFEPSDDEENTRLETPESLRDLAASTDDSEQRQLLEDEATELETQGIRERCSVIFEAADESFAEVTSRVSLFESETALSEHISAFNFEQDCQGLEASLPPFGDVEAWACSGGGLPTTTVHLLFSEDTTLRHVFAFVPWPTRTPTPQELAQVAQQALELALTLAQQLPAGE